MSEKRFVQLGTSQVNLNEIARDPRGIEDMLTEVLENDWAENRYKQFKAKLSFFADAADIAEWDNSLLYRFPPLYTEPKKLCTDCSQGPCNLESSNGRCGLEYDPFQARQSLRVACQGCLTQMAATRELLNYALKLFGRDHPASMGRNMTMSDEAPSIGIMTGLYVKNLGDLDRVQSYAEAQLTKLLAASYSAKGSVFEFEEMTLHAGSILFVAMDVAELVKISCFGFTTSGNQELAGLNDYPPANTLGGFGNVAKEKPVIAFVGDNFLPAWFAVNYLKDNKLTEKVEICGIGPAGDDIVRFYDKGRLITTMVKARKAIRTGFADVIVASSSCVSFDIPEDARRVESRLIWTSPEGGMGLIDMTDDPVEEIVERLVEGTPGVVVKIPDKAGEVAVKVAQKVKRKASYLLSNDEVITEAKKCNQDCDLCFSVCPNSLLLSKAIKMAAKEGVSALTSVANGCYLCGKCEDACPSKIRLLDMIVAAFASRAQDDKLVMRAGRGPISETELRAEAFAFQWGNCPANVMMLGCGDARIQEDLGYIAYELISLGCMLHTAGCAAAEIARYFNQEQQKFIFQEFPAEAQPVNILNCGGCTAHAHLMDVSLKLARLGAGISHYGNYAEVADYDHNHFNIIYIIWGVLPERMFTMAAGFARSGMPVIIGPESGFQWKRFLIGNKYDRSKWFMYDGVTGQKKETAPAPKHLIIPVETKEEAIVTAISLIPRPLHMRDNRATTIRTYTELHERYFGELPDDWQLFLRSDVELPPRSRYRLLQELQNKHGWETERFRVKRARHRDGRLLTMEEYSHNYGIEQGRYATSIPRLVVKQHKKES